MPAVVRRVDSVETVSDDPATEGVVSVVVSPVGIDVEATIVVSEDEPVCSVA